MTERRTIGNMLAPPRFLAFLATLLIGVPVARWVTAPIVLEGRS